MKFCRNNEVSSSKTKIPHGKNFTDFLSDVYFLEGQDTQ
jgi:hypothetical protein